MMRTKSQFSRVVYAIRDRIWCNKHLRHTATEKYEYNGKGGYFRFDDDNNMSYEHVRNRLDSPCAIISNSRSNNARNVSALDNHLWIRKWLVTGHGPSNCINHWWLLCPGHNLWMVDTKSSLLNVILIKLRYQVGMDVVDGYFIQKHSKHLSAHPSKIFFFLSLSNSTITGITSLTRLIHVTAHCFFANQCCGFSVCF